uniref:Ovule protein n=1 Tax=Mesocestoides corti TaxID=53468 RepID=A0A5K3FH19_MESCO
SQNYTSGAFHPNPPRWIRCSLYTTPHSCPSLVGCLYSLHAIGTQIDRGLAEAIVQYVCALRRRHSHYILLLSRALL